MIKIGMCDDKLETLISVNKFLEAEMIEQSFDGEITLITDDQKQVFDAVYNKEIDILILDIDFKSFGKNGIDFAKDLRNINKDFILIFLSAHQKFMPLSFFVKVFDFIIKPINRETIELLVSRLIEEFKYSKKFFLPLSKWVSVRISDIIYIEKIGNKSQVITKDQTYTTTKNLNSILDELPKEFKKSHRSFIINENKIISIDKKNNYVYFEDGFYCPINSYFDI